MDITALLEQLSVIFYIAYRLGKDLGTYMEDWKNGHPKKSG